MRFEVTAVSKSFGGTRALSQVSFAVAPGRIHAVLGENGAGKSTLMNIAAGALSPDTGSLRLDGEPYAPRDPLAARKAGVAIVYQELSVCPHLTVLENILLGVESARFGWISAQKSRERVERALAFVPELPQRLRLDAPVASLSSAERQLVEIARALTAERPRLLILDEPTSSLGRDDVELLFAALTKLRERGMSLLYISHFLEEVRRIADDFTVLRDGRSLRSGRIADVTNDELIAEMAGQSGRSTAAAHEQDSQSGRSTAAAHEAATARQFEERPRGELVLEATALAGARLPLDASFQLFSGEIFGIAGLVGSGRSELLRALFGLDAVRRGQVRLGHFSGAATPRSRLAQGVGLLSEDRKGEGLALELSIAENLTLSKLTPLRRRGLLSRAAQAAVSEQWTARLGVRARSVHQPVAELSGGNQQKVALGRLLYHDVDVLLLDEPTRGIDVRSRAEIHALVSELAARGKAVLLVSSQLPELLAVCDRIAVMYRGKLGPAAPRSAWSEHDLLLAATGAGAAAERGSNLPTGAA